MSDSSCPHELVHQACLSFTISQSSFKLMSIELVMPSNHLILCCPLLLLPSIFPSIRIFSNESSLWIRWPKYWSFNFSISPSNEYSGLISIRIDWFDLLAVQGTLKSLLQHHSSKASVLQHSALFMVQLFRTDLLAVQGTLKSFLQHHSSKASVLQCSALFMIQLSHPYMTTGKTTALIKRTFVGKVMSLLFNMLSSFVIAFLPRSMCLLISWLQSPSAVILEPKKTNSVIVSIVSPSTCHKVVGLDAMILGFWMLSFKSAFSLSFTFIKRLFSSFLLSAIRMAYLRLLIFLPAILIPACASSSPAFHMMHSAYKLNKQSDNIQPWCTPFPIWNQLVVPCLVLMVASWPAYKFLRRQVRWYVRKGNSQLKWLLTT